MSTEENVKLGKTQVMFKNGTDLKLNSDETYFEAIKTLFEDVTSVTIPLTDNLVVARNTVQYIRFFTPEEVEAAALLIAAQEEASNE